MPTQSHLSSEIQQRCPDCQGVGSWWMYPECDCCDPYILECSECGGAGKRNDMTDDLLTIYALEVCMSPEDYYQGGNWGLNSLYSTEEFCLMATEEFKAKHPNADFSCDGYEVDDPNHTL